MYQSIVVIGVIYQAQGPYAGARVWVSCILPGCRQQQQHHQQQQATTSALAAAGCLWEQQRWQ